MQTVNHILSDNERYENRESDKPRCDSSREGIIRTEVTEAMVQLQKTKSTFEGNYTLVVFPFLKISRKKPEDTAQEIGEYIAKTL